MMSYVLNFCTLKVGRGCPWVRVEADAEDRGFKRVRGGNGLDDRFGEAFGDSLKPSGMRQTFRHV